MKSNLVFCTFVNYPYVQLTEKAIHIHNMYIRVLLYVFIQRKVTNSDVCRFPCTERKMRKLASLILYHQHRSTSPLTKTDFRRLSKQAYIYGHILCNILSNKQLILQFLHVMQSFRQYLISNTIFIEKYSCTENDSIHKCANDKYTKICIVQLGFEWESSQVCKYVHMEHFFLSQIPTDIKLFR